MINFEFNIRNPWSDRFENIKSWSRLVSTYKAVEFNLYKTNHVIDLRLSISHRQSHAGFQIELGLLGYNMEFHAYDTRHWDHVNNKWETYEHTNC